METENRDEKIALLTVNARVIKLCQELESDGNEYLSIVFSLVTAALDVMVANGESDEDIHELYQIALQHAKGFAPGQLGLDRTHH